MTRTDKDPNPSTTNVGNDDGRDIENNLSVDSLVETLRNKLEAGRGECIYRLGDPCKWSAHSSS